MSVAWAFLTIGLLQAPVRIPPALTATFVGTTAADLVVTLAALPQGYTERNPLMAPLAAHPPLLLAGVAGATAATLWASTELRRRHFPLWWAPVIVGTALRTGALVANLRLVL